MKTDTLVQAIGATEARTRNTASKRLQTLSEERPEQVYPHFNFLADLTRGDNNILKWNALLTLANLAAVDSAKKLDRMLDEYLAPVRGPVMITAGNAMKGAAVIAAAKPYLADRIAGAIFQVERAKYATPECRNVAVGHAIQALGKIFPSIEDKRAVVSFVTRQKKNPRAATRAKAIKFLKKQLV